MQIVGLDEHVDVFGGAPTAEIAVEREAATDEEGRLCLDERAQALRVDELLLGVPALAIACFHDDLRAIPQ